MARSRPKWWDAALAILLQGGRISAAARAANVRRETVSNAMRDPQHPFAKELAQLRAAAEASSATPPAELVAKAQRVLEQHLDGEDARTQLDAAKAVLARVEPPPQDAASTEAEQVTPEIAVRELVATLPTVKVVLQLGPVPAALVDELRRALETARRDLDALPAAPPPSAPPAPPAPPSRPPLLN